MPEWELTIGELGMLAAGIDALQHMNERRNPYLDELQAKIQEVNQQFMDAPIAGLADWRITVSTPKTKGTSK